MDKVFLIFAILFLAATAMRPPPPNDDSCNFGVEAAKESSKAVGNLAVKLYQKIAKPDENVIFSPVSIALALALVESGAAGGTRNEIQRLLGPPGSNQADSSELYQSLQHQLQIRGENSRLSIANGLFTAKDLRLIQEYLDKTQKCFETRVSQEPFAENPEEARQRINRWVSDATAEKIPELFKERSITSGTRAVLANAVYMKAAWKNKFERSEDLPFYRSGKSDQAQSVRFMVQEETFGYVSNDSFEAIELPYDGAPLRMYIILPKQRDGLQAVEQSLEGEDLISLFGQTRRHQVNVKLPKFTIRQSVDLKSILQQLGLEQMFSDRANFSRMAVEPLRVSDAVHEAYIKVNENGTEAAAATGFMMVAMAMPMQPEPPIPFIADHPFLFVVVHKPTSAIAFMGRVNSVQEE